VLIYPYLRPLPLGIVLWEHIASILVHQESIRIIIRCLLQIRSIMDRSDMYYLGNKLYVDPYLIWIQQYRATSDDHHPDTAAAAASGGNSNNYIATNFLIPMAHSIRQQLLLVGDSNHIHPMKDNLGLNLMQIDTEWLNCQEDDNESEQIINIIKTIFTRIQTNRMRQIVMPIHRQVTMITIVVLLRKGMKILRNRRRTTGDDVITGGLQQLQLGSDHSLDALKLCNEFKSLSTTETSNELTTTTRLPLIQEVDL
jgi:hypothetical protein